MKASLAVTHLVALFAMANESEVRPDSFAGGAPFPPTLWSVVLLAGENSSNHSHAALATLCRAYWFPLYAFIRRQGKSPEDAEDLTQGFLLHLVEKETLTRVRREKGKFRSFLLGSLKFFLSDETGKQRAQKRGGGAAVGRHAGRAHVFAVDESDCRRAA